MTYPDRANTLALLTEWAKHHAAVEKLMDGIESSMGLDLNGPLFATVWALFYEYTEGLAARVGDEDEWLEWYCSETDMGKRAKQVTFNGKTSRIKTLANLCTLLIRLREAD
jgi:hypothetical protein